MDSDIITVICIEVNTLYDFEAVNNIACSFSDCKAENSVVYLFLGRAAEITGEFSTLSLSFSTARMDIATSAHCQSWPVSLWVTCTSSRPLMSFLFSSFPCTRNRESGVKFNGPAVMNQANSTPQNETINPRHEQPPTSSGGCLRQLIRARLESAAVPLEGRSRGTSSRHHTHLSGHLCL